MKKKDLYKTFYFSELEEAFYANKSLSKDVIFIPIDTNFQPHYPNYGKHNKNVKFNGTKKSKYEHFEEDNTYLWVNTECLWRNHKIHIDITNKKGELFITSICFTKDNYDPIYNIPIPTGTYSNKSLDISYPKTIKENIIRLSKYKYLVSFKGQTNTPERKKMYELLQHIPEYLIISNGRQYGGTNTTGTIPYYDLIYYSLFSLVPVGDGWISYRLMEVMATGSIPIIISDQWVLPFESFLNWKEFSIIIKFEELERLPIIIKNNMVNYHDMSNKCFEIYHKYFKNGDAIMKGIEEHIKSVEISK